MCVCLFQLVAVFDVRRGRAESPEETMSNGHSGMAPSPEPLHYFSHLQQQQQEQPMRGEIEVNEAVLKASMSDLLKNTVFCSRARGLSIQRLCAEPSATGELKRPTHFLFFPFRACAVCACQRVKKKKLHFWNSCNLNLLCTDGGISPARCLVT